MTDKPFSKKLPLYRATDEKLIRAFARAESSDVFHPVSFDASSIDHIMGIQENSAAITLRSGVKVVVAMSYEKLNDKIYMDGGDVLDLRDVTGEAAKDIIAPHLSRDFEMAAKKENAAEKGLKFRAYLREGNTNRFVAYEFFEAAVSAFEPVASNRSKTGQSVKIHFNASWTSGPFYDGVAYLDMPHEEFRTHLDTAKLYRRSGVDFCGVFAENKNRYGLKS